MNDSVSGSHLGYVPCYDAGGNFNSTQEFKGTPDQFQALRYGLELKKEGGKFIIYRNGQIVNESLSDYVAKQMIAQVDKNGKVLNSPTVQVVDDKGQTQVIDFEKNRLAELQYQGAFCGYCGGFTISYNGSKTCEQAAQDKISKKDCTVDGKKVENIDQ
ncbi:hypothetical protein HZB69_00480, partial [Candidatus Amesbacteria bacterium]|nr:hypothetical protein [Candidatus Amesbacteria bacterium]